MSDINIQDSPAAQGAVDLQAEVDATAKATKGFVGSQVFPITGATSIEVDPVTLSQRAKCVDANHLQGSNQGDHRAKAAPAVLPANPGPREWMTQAPNGRNAR